MIEVSQIIENVTINTEELTQEAIINTSEVVEVVLLEVGESIPEAPIDGQIYGRKDASWEAVTGGASSADDITETATRVFVTPEKRTLLNSITEAFTTALKNAYDGVVTGYNALILTGQRLVTSDEIAKLSNTNGTNTGDQDLSNYALDANVLHKTGDEIKTGSLEVIDNGLGYGLKAITIYGYGIDAFSSEGVASLNYSPNGTGMFAISDYGVGAIIGSTAGEKIVSFTGDSGTELAYLLSSGLFKSNKLLVNTDVDNGVDAVQVPNGSVLAKQYKLTSLNTAPASATATGTTGEIRYTATHIYFCIARNTYPE